jgi:hypothetical protein
MKSTSRNKLIFDLFAKGLTYAAIAGKTGISRQRVQQITRPPIKILLSLKKRAKGRCEDCGIELLSSGHAHHISRCGDFNDLRNLEHLCRSCHRQAHSNGRRDNVRRYNDFRQMCVLWIRENRPDVVTALYKELDKRFPSARKRSIKLPKSLQKKEK